MAARVNKMVLLCSQSSAWHRSFEMLFNFWQLKSSSLAPDPELCRLNICLLYKCNNCMKRDELTVRTWVSSLHRARSVLESAGSPQGCPRFRGHGAYLTLWGGYKQDWVARLSSNIMCFLWHLLLRSLNRKCSKFFSAFWGRVRWEHCYHSHICKVNMKLAWTPSISLA